MPGLNTWLKNILRQEPDNFLLGMASMSEKLLLEDKKQDGEAAQPEGIFHSIIS